MQDFIAALVTLALVDPLQNEISEALAGASAPQEIVAAVATCASEHGSQIVDRAVNDPWWAASSALSVWVGFAEPYALLVEAAPECSGAIEAISPFLGVQEGQNG